MHEYSTSYHNRKNVYYFIAVISSLIGIGIALLIKLSLNTFELAIIAPSGLAVFGLTFLVFDRFIWKWSIMYNLGLIRIPNLNGKWTATMNSATTENPDISAEINIHQTYSRIKIRLETQKSHSLSTMASIEMADPEYFKLRYEYLAEFQKDISSEIIRHYGVTDIALKSHNEKFDNKQNAKYYTEQIRNSNGIMKMTRSDR